MGFCTSCGSTIADEARFCERCGLPAASKSIIETARANTIEVIAPPAATWHVTFATGQTGGPFTEDEIKSMIARQEIKITDSVVLSGGSTWVPITQSPFAGHIVTQSQRRSACGKHLPPLRSSHGSCIAAFKGWLGAYHYWPANDPIVWHWSANLCGRLHLRWGFKGKAKYQCPRCNYRT